MRTKEDHIMQCRYIDGPDISASENSLLQSLWNQSLKHSYDPTIF